ncbi:hypothetical protein K435DRAFT_839629 [Dendrothele bispora CBS 962.96]|uniref:DUF6534 domain-containing protein n=1 Tax=Dendrothele bispora (strain CBS 962.96) TaxID=1314807 RepID=A0A4S8LZA7_DENBC|nr:hypothetical protein K435DRAFT_839629 [Dendrothele bispora CBS 962.96]
MSALPDRPTPISQSEFAASYGPQVDQATGIIDRISLQDLICVGALQRYSQDSNKLFDIVCQLTYRFVVLYALFFPLRVGMSSHQVGAIIGYLTIVLVQAFYARTIYYCRNKEIYLDDSFFLKGVILTIQHSAFGLCWVVKELMLWKISIHYPRGFYSMGSKALGSTSYIATTSSLCLTLYDTKIHFESSMRLIRMILIYAMNRLVLTTIVGVAQTIMIIVDVNNISGYSIDYISLHLYVNSFLAALNARNTLRGGSAMSYSTSWEANPRSARVDLPGVSSSMDDPQPPLNAYVDPNSSNVRQTQKGGSVATETESYPLSNLDSKPEIRSHIV